MSCEVDVVNGDSVGERSISDENDNVLCHLIGLSGVRKAGCGSDGGGHD